MIWSDASWRVAMMATVQSFWDWAVGKKPCEAVRDDFRARRGQSKPSISMLVCMPYPKPAGIGFVDEFPESYVWRYLHGNTITYYHGLCQ